jgi:hypothetical protein
LVLSLIWAAGVLALAARAVSQNIFFRQVLRQGRPLNDAPTQEIFENCKSLMGVKAPVALIETEGVKSPALYGLFQPRLLLPPGLVSRFGSGELRHIFLHELAHVRRRDMALQWVVTWLQIIHWFNPILWLGFRRMAADREVACDELALAVAGEAQRRDYGRTIVKLLESFAESSSLPGLVGILEDKSQIVRRISMIAAFQKHPRWSAAGTVALAGLGLVTLTEAQSDKTAKVVRPELTGTVLTTKGDPVKATVFVDSAGPEVGTSPLCPSCYADCRKRGKTDSSGHFKIAALDPELRFRILVVGEGCQPKFVGHVDPAAGPITVNLEVRTLANVPADRTVTGRVVDPSGASIAGATVEATGIHYQDGQAEFGGEFDETDAMAVSGPDGKFVLASGKDIVSLDVQVQAHGYADRTFKEIAAGAKPADLRMTEGAAIRGRVVFQGKPFPNGGVGIVSEDRNAENFAGHFETGTDQDGKFLFANLPPNVRYQVYALMDTVKDYGASPVALVQAGGDGSMADAGDLVVAKAHQISGRVVLADGKPVPDKTRLMLGREDSWDSQIMELGKDGSFHLKGVPTATMSVCVAVEGYKFSAKNKSLDKANPFELIGRVNGDITNLTILFDKEGFHGPRGAYAEYQLRQTEPLQGVEGSAAIRRNDFGEELADVFRPSSLLLGNQAGAQPAVQMIDVPALKGDSKWTNWDWEASTEKRRNILVKEYEAPTVTSAAAPRNSDSPAFSLVSSDFAKYLSAPPWIRQMTYLHWQAESSDSPRGETARWVLETNLAAIQPNGFFKQELAFSPRFAWSSMGEKIISGMSKDYFWRASQSKLHQLFISPREPNPGASDNNNPQRLSHCWLQDLEQIRHLGLPALQPNTFAFENDLEFSATTRAGETLKGRIMRADRDRPITLMYKVGEGTNPAVSVNYRYRAGSSLPSYIEIDRRDPKLPRSTMKMISIKTLEYGVDSRVPDGYEPSQFFPDMKDFDDVQLWKNGERFSVAPDGRQVKIGR